MQDADPVDHPRRPSPRSAAKVEALCVGGEGIKRKNMEISIGQRIIFCCPQSHLIERSPLRAKSLDGGTVDVIAVLRSRFGHEFVTEVVVFGREIALFVRCAPVIAANPR